MAIQEAVGVAHYKLFKLARIIWVSRKKSITKIIEQYNALVSYLQEECKTDKIDGVRKEFYALTNCGTKHILLFL